MAAGLVLFVAAIASSRSQPLDCAQPNPDGCPLELESSVAAVLSGEVLIHRWRIQVPASADGTANLWVTLPAPPADFDLYVANGNGAIVGRSIEDGPFDELVRLTNIPPGTYVALVISPRCARTPQPYLLLASATQAPGLAPTAQVTDGPPMPPDVATLLGGGLGSCGAPTGPPAVLNPYGSNSGVVDPYTSTSAAP